jgi:hypothetical protein
MPQCLDAARLSPLAATRIGEARKPGPLDAFDDPWAQMDFDEDLCPYDTEMHDAVAWEGPPPDHSEAVATPSPTNSAADAHCRKLKLDPSVGFAESKAFVGSNAGWVYKTGPLGRGYYIDEPAKVVQSFVQESSAPVDDMLLSYILSSAPAGLEGKVFLSLDLLVPPESMPRLLGSGKRLNRSLKRLPRRKRKIIDKSAQWMQPSILGVSRTDTSHRASGAIAIDTYNGNIMSTAQVYIASSAADIICIQEARLPPWTIPAAERAARRAKWSLSVEPAAITAASSTSAGVAVAVRSHIGMCNVPSLPWFANLDSRLSVKHVSAICKGGVYILSAYFWCSIGITGQNVQLLESIAFLIRRLRGPWILAADWNFGPSSLEKNGWLRLVDGRVRASGVATCKGRENDWYVVSRSINHAILGVARITDTGANPHSAVRLWVKSHARKDLVRSLAAPPKADAVQPAGCHNQCELEGWSDIAADPQHLSFSQGKLDTEFARWIRASEEGLCSIGGLTGKDHDKFVCRDQGAKLVWKSAIGPVSNNGLKVSLVTVAWKTIHTWLSELSEGMSQMSPQGLVAKAARARWLLLSSQWGYLGASMHATALADWIGQLSLQILSDRSHIMWLRATAAVIAKKTHEHDCRKSEAAWTAWLHGGPGRSIGRHHRLTKVGCGWAPSPSLPTPDEPEAAEHEQDDEEITEQELAAAECFPISPQEEADHAAIAWGKEWNANGYQLQLPWPDSCWSPDLPALSVEVLLNSARTFPSGTGLGWDKMHPKAIIRLPTVAILALARICIMAEVLGMWPSVIGIVLICLIPKTDGGRRPIGLLPTVIRWWMRARLDVVRAWQNKHERVYFYAGPGKGAKVASWKQAARAELAQAIPGTDYACSLLDMVKAFERVPLDWLVRQGIRYTYPMQILRLSIRAYQLPRTIVIDGVCSELLLALRGITAGAGHATVELRLLIIQWADEAISLFAVTISIFVDDASIEASGSTKFVVNKVAGATKHFTSSMQKIGMEWSPTKNAILAAKRDTAKQVIDRLPGLRINFTSRAKSLGGALGAGNKRNVKVQAQRLKAFRARKTQFQQFRRMAGAHAVSRVLRTGGIAAMVYGQANTGVSNSMLHSQRVATAAAGSRGGSGELDLVLIFLDGGPRGMVDPAFAAHEDPIGHWAEATWCSWLPRCALTKMLNAAIVKQKDRKSPWSVVYGPAAAYLATARRLGWVVDSAVTVTTDIGCVIDFSRDSPAFVIKLVQESVRRWRWRRVEDKHPSLRQGRGGYGAHVLPILQLLNSRRVRDDWTPAAKGGLVSTATNRQWTQARLYQANLTTSLNCRLCVAMGLCDPCDPDPKHKGTLVHRYWICPVLHPYRLKSVPAMVIEAARKEIAVDGTMQSAENLYYCRAIRPSLQPKVPAQNPYESFQWVVSPPSSFSTAGCSIYIDGSLLFNEAKYCGLAARRGWALAVYNSADELIAAANGRPPHWVQGIHGTELWGLLQSLQLGPIDCQLHTDCMAVLLGAKRGIQWANDPRRTFSRMWGPVASALEDNLDSLVWGPAHCTGSQVAGKKLSNGAPMRQRHRIGNAEVDTRAKEGASADKLPVSTLKWIEAKGDDLVAIALWIGKCTAMANRFRDPRGDPNAKATYLRDSEGLAATRLQKYKAGRKRKAPAIPIQLYDLSQCPRWQRIRQRILDRAAALDVP